jgi:hypothetical protein
MSQHEKQKAKRREVYHSDPERFRGYQKKYRINHFTASRKAFVEWKKDNPEKYRSWAVAVRLIPLKPNCEICSSIENLQRHHKDYGKPLEVLTLCRDCHNALEVIEPSICTKQSDIRYYKGYEPVEVLDHPRVKLGQKWPCKVLRTGEVKEITVGHLCYLQHKIKRIEIK